MTLAQFLCGLRGHDVLLQFETPRVRLRCTACGHQSPGWTTAERPPTPRFEGDPRRHAIVRPRLVTTRRRA